MVDLLSVQFHQHTRKSIRSEVVKNFFYDKIKVVLVMSKFKANDFALQCRLLQQLTVDTITQ
jgi:hypothetical protein